MTAVDCPDPSGCPVPDPPSGPAPALLSTRIATGATVCRAYELRFGYGSFNPGVGDTRFAPLTTSTGVAVPTLYGGVDDESVLLETVLHDVHHAVADRIIYESVVRQWGLAFIRLPRELSLVDLRDDALGALGVTRDQLVATTAEHYPCTRAWARWLHTHPFGDRAPDGILWHSRQAELHIPGTRREVFVLWGDRAPTDPSAYSLTGPGVCNLVEGPGRVLLDRLAEDLSASVEPAES